MQTQMTSKLAREIAKDRKKLERGMFRSSSQCRQTLDIHKRAAMALKGKDDGIGMAILRNVLAVVLVGSFMVLVAKL